MCFGTRTKEVPQPIITTTGWYQIPQVDEPRLSLNPEATDLGGKKEGVAKRRRGTSRLQVPLVGTTFGAGLGIPKIRLDK